MDEMLNVAVAKFRATVQSELLYEKIEQMNRDCETMFTEDERDFAVEYFERLFRCCRARRTVCLQARFARLYHNFEKVRCDIMSKITYSKHGDYYLPDLTLSEQKEFFFGRYGRLRLNYLKNHRRILYINLLTFCKLSQHLVEVDEQAK